MELPHLRQHCSRSDCNKLDFLPIKCDACSSLFCEEHYSYTNHNCANSYKKNNQVPVCPLCSKPIPVKKGELPDFVVGAHIDSDCQSDPAKSRRKVFTNRCTFKKCKNRELLPVVCDQCHMNFCIKHRHTVDHNCAGKPTGRWIFDALPRGSTSEKVQGNLSEDEALARALALSFQDSGVNSKKRQEELDLALARQLQAAESGATTAPSRDSRNVCNLS
ncbi:AN1-type zinc finger protein 2A [Leptinotarsa decemlineata]|uniref:AN1-type zinc finger protein 2A n=1 Tax=Leptinotarsa decemlineata TaxID=7539 RepID=UPI003D30C123